MHRSFVLTPFTGRSRAPSAQDVDEHRNSFWKFLREKPAAGKYSVAVETVVAAGTEYNEASVRPVLDIEDTNHLASTLANLGATGCIALVMNGAIDDRPMSLQDGVNAVRAGRRGNFMHCR
jgi:hypothetical protein